MINFDFHFSANNYSNYAENKCCMKFFLSLKLNIKYIQKFNNNLATNQLKYLIKRFLI